MKMIYEKNMVQVLFWCVRTSYVKVPPEEPGWRRVTLEMAPLAERMHMALGPFWEKEKILAATS